MSPAPGKLAAAVVLLVTSTALAAGEDEWQLSASLGGADVGVDGRAPFGPFAGVDLKYGLDDAWAARVSFAGSTHGVSEEPDKELPGGSVRALSAVGGVSYTFDVLRLVPYVDFGVGVMRLSGALKEPGSTLAVELGFGADFWLTRRWAVGGVIRYMFTPVEVFAAPEQLGGTPFFFAAAARLSWLY